MGSGLAACPRPASACSVPVFRYALERWPPDLYEVVVFHRGALTGPPRALVDRLEKMTATYDSPVNVAVKTVDLAEEVGEGRKILWEAQEGAKLPWVVVRYPRIPDRSAWSGPLEGAAIEAVLDSPVRREIGRRIARGDTAVWVLLESGDPAADDAASRLLDAELKKLVNVLEQPAPADDAGPKPEPGSGPKTRPAADPITDDTTPVAVAFSMLRLSRRDPAETVLVNMLLDSEPDLRTFDEPIAFPVFGRGRVLWALVGRGINESTILESGAFLAGPCSCVVKVENPGTDLLMTMDWEAAAEGLDPGGQDAAPLAAAGEPGDDPADVLAASINESANGGLLRNSVLAAGVGILIVAGIAWMLMRRDRSYRP